MTDITGSVGAGHARTHRYSAAIRWIGNRGTGTNSYRSYGRAHEIHSLGKPTIVGSADAAFRGDPVRWNPEELLVVSLSQCHLLWYLHLAATSGVVVTDYFDEPVGTMSEARDGSGEFTDVLLRPTVTVADDSMVQAAENLHDAVHATCFIARSVTFPVRHQPTTRVASADGPDGPEGPEVPPPTSRSAREVSGAQPGQGFVS